MSETIAIGLESGMKRGSQESAIEEIAQFRDSVFRLALAIMAHRDQAEDVAQDVLLQSLKHWTQIENPPAWFRKTTVRRCLEVLKRERRTAPSDQPSPEDETTRIAVEAVLIRLKAEHRVVLALNFLEGLSYREIAEALSVPEGTVSSRLSAAKAAFQQAWEK